MDTHMMNFYIYDQSFNKVAVIDEYSSLIWSDRFNECGDFELDIPYALGKGVYGNYLIQDNYCGIDYSDRKAIIEKIEYEHEEDSAPMMKVSGRSLESILERRLVLGKTEFGTESSPVSVQNSIQSVLNSHVINPVVVARKIAGFSFSASTDIAITDLKFTDTYDGDDLYSVVSGICQDKKIGFKIINSSGSDLVFSLYPGVDRSKNQAQNPFVVFSPAYDNLMNTNFVTSTEEYKNMMYIGIGEGTAVQAYFEPVPSGITRREVFIDQDELKENNSVTLTNDQLKSKGKKKLTTEYKVKTGIEGEIVPGILYTYGTDYMVGDKVQLTDIYGNTDVARISEVVISCDEGGLQIIPTFEDIEEK